jgi:hypothetical protein
LEKWNRVKYSSETICIGPLHSDFADSKTIPHSNVESMMVATPEKCEQKFQSMMSELNKRIEQWERIGQGEGGEQAYYDMTMMMVTMKWKFVFPPWKKGMDPSRIEVKVHWTRSMPSSSNTTNLT